MNFSHGVAVKTSSSYKKFEMLPVYTAFYKISSLLDKINPIKPPHFTTPFSQFSVYTIPAKGESTQAQESTQKWDKLKMFLYQDEQQQFSPPHSFPVRSSQKILRNAYSNLFLFSSLVWVPMALSEVMYYVVPAFLRSIT